MTEDTTTADIEPKDENGLTQAEVAELLRRKADLEAGLGTVHELIEVYQ